MRRAALLQYIFSVCLILYLVLGGNGCVSPPPEQKAVSEIGALQEDNVNPLFVRTDNEQYLWEAIVDVIDNYFPIAEESPVRSLKKQTSDGTVYYSRTEGRIDTKPVIAAGLLQPWRKTSVDVCQRLEATLQTERRYAVVRVVPEDNGYLIHLAVYNEIENLPQPMNSGITGNNMTFGNDINQIEQPAGETAPAKGWIPIGRNYDLEQYILKELAWRINNPPSLVNEPKSPQLVP
ncbi:MAG: hypothetical protein IKW74_06325 [Thermoguttaceae bacterium]|nr:hypothetical protein [Thermoguttaceae bacterium]